MKIEVELADLLAAVNKFGAAPFDNGMVGEFVIVRCRDAGAGIGG